MEIIYGVYILEEGLTDDNNDSTDKSKESSLSISINQNPNFVLSFYCNGKNNILQIKYQFLKLRVFIV